MATKTKRREEGSIDDLQEKEAAGPKKRDEGRKDKLQETEAAKTR